MPMQESYYDRQRSSWACRTCGRVAWDCECSLPPTEALEMQLPEEADLDTGRLDARLADLTAGR